MSSSQTSPRRSPPRYFAASSGDGQMVERVSASPRRSWSGRRRRSSSSSCGMHPAGSGCRARTSSQTSRRETRRPVGGGFQQWLASPAVPSAQKIAHSGYGVLGRPRLIASSGRICGMARRDVARLVQAHVARRRFRRGHQRRRGRGRALFIEFDLTVRSRPPAFHCASVARPVVQHARGLKVSPVEGGAADHGRGQHLVWSLSPRSAALEREWLIVKLGSPPGVHQNWPALLHGIRINRTERSISFLRQRLLLASGIRSAPHKAGGFSSSGWFLNWSSIALMPQNR